MDKRYQVFVSSTFRDLGAERSKVLQALLDEEHIPTGMELWPAADPAALAVVKSYLHQCDYYVLIIGGMYGTVHPEKNLSYTEIEYDIACESKIPVLAFLHRNPLKIEAGKSELDQVKREKLEAFKSKVAGKHTLKEWENADELRYHVTNAIRHAIKNNPRTGWVRADTPLADPRVYVELEQLRKENSLLKAKLDLQQDQPPSDADQYLGLDHNTAIWGRVSAEWREHQPQGGSITRYATEFETKFVTTFGEVFKALGFQAWAGARNIELQSTLTNLVFEQAKLWPREPAGVDPRGLVWTVNNASGSTADCSRLTLHFFALGLFAHESDSTSKEPRWVLTNYGRSKLVALLAARKG